MPLVDLLVSAGLAEGRGPPDPPAGGVYLNNRRLADERKAVTLDDTRGGELWS